MDILKHRCEILLKHTSTKYVRSLYYGIDWSCRLIGIKGARGVGKTTMFLQRILLAFPDRSKALYISLDDIWFASHTLLEVAEEASSRGITHLFIDEVHRMKGWERQIKNIYDFFPNLFVAFTGSSLLVIDNSIADLSRRAIIYELPGLSFREYLSLEGYTFPEISLSDILYDHNDISNKIISETDILKSFKKYLLTGYYPFYITESKESYLIRVRNILAGVIDLDIPAVADVEYSTLQKLKRLVGIMAAQHPSPLNAKATAEMLEVTNAQLIKLLSLLSRSQILRLLYFNNEVDPKSLRKPQKVLFSNTSILYALGNADLGKVRESFLASMLAVRHEIGYTKEGDLRVDCRYLIEVGGAGKGFSQIADLPDSFVAADDITTGFGNKIPLWLFGFLY